ncbi:hypothetical protein DRH29_02415 [candidate division Kazan bacterium]|uniref:SbsA Ig-like domain-containing protein n=1 Tax=candidate division Kazan bacterium TaxID=2202143 RepID=A0A420ZCU1_UNCK3|nr:MAG: hypothetical protein DRH29_02415 [candidate division Kazan bacterium]
MPNNLQVKLKRVTSVIATVALVLQGFLPGGFLNIQPARAATGTWHFTDPNNYTLGNGTVVGDTYAFARLDLTASSDDLDSHGPTTDLIETDTAGRILAGVGEWPAPYSTNYGDTWTQDNPIEGGGEISTIKFTKITMGPNEGRIIGVGYDPGTPDVGGWSYTDDDGANWTGHNTIAGSTKWGAVYYEPITGRVWAGTNDPDNEIYYSLDDGLSFINVDQGDLSNVLEIHEIIADSSGDTIYAAATISGSSSTTTSIFYTTDTGLTWTQATRDTAGTAHASVYDLAVDSNDYIYAITSGAHILKSTEASGTVFSEVSISDLSNARSIHIDGNDEIIISSAGGIIYRSFDGGNDFINQTAESSADISYVHALIRMSNYTYLLGTEGPMSSGNAYSGTFNNTQNETTGPVITTKSGTGVIFSSISAFSETYPTPSETSTGVKYRITNDDNQATWYYWTGSEWDVSSGLADMNTADTINTNIGQFDDDVGTGTFHFQAYLTNAGGAHVNASVALDYVEIEYILGTITVTAPNGNEDWGVGSTYDITWTSVGLGSGNIIDITYTIEGQDSQNIVENTANDGAYEWQIPNTPDSQIKVTISSGAIEDSSDDYFTISVPGGNDSDGTKPTSSINPLPQYTGEAEFTISVAASDNVGVSSVKLYYSNQSEINHQLWGTDNSAPFNFTFNAAGQSAWGDGRYNFYACAEDFSGNSDCADKNLPFDGETLPTIEAYTIVDTIAPHMQSAIPSNLNTRTSADQDVAIGFSEAIDTATFAYQLYATETEESVTGLETVWSNNNQQVSIKHPTLEYDTWYTFKIVNAKDLAGHNLVENSTPLEWYFKTIVKLDPDLTNSTIRAAKGTNPDGSYNTGDVVSYTITLTNTSDLPSSNTVATLTLNKFLVYKVGSADSTSGTVSLQQQNGQVTGLRWNGVVSQGSDATITFQAIIDETVDSFQIQQQVVIADGINPDYVPAPAIINIASAANFSESTITVNKTEAPVGSSLHYEVTIKNTGSTIAQAAVFNTLPSETTYIPGTLRSESDRLVVSYNNVLNRVETIAIIPIGGSISFSYSALIKPHYETGYIIVNSVTAQDITSSSEVFSMQTETKIDNTILLSPELSQVLPVPNATGLALDTEVDLDFNVELNPSTFQFTVGFKYYNQQQNISGWQAHWSNGNTHVKLKPPSNLAVGATYVIDITNAEDVAGNILAESTFPKKWTFTTVSPSITVSETEPLKMVEQGHLEGPIIVQIIDTTTGEPYVTPDNLTISVHTTSPTGEIMLKDPDGTYRPTAHVRIAANTSESAFYYRNSRASLPGFDTLTLFENPSLGFPDVQMPIVVTDTPVTTTPKDTLDISLPSREIENTDTFSEPLLVKAKDIFGNSTQLPEILYFYSQSKTGKFYDGSLKELPTGVQVQNIGPTNNVQYFKSESPLNSAVFYYRDITPGASIITISDNPLSDKKTGCVITAPDTGFRNASAVLEVLESIEFHQKQPATARLANIIAINDNSDRVLDHIKILPTSTQMLPNTSKTFYAQGYDTQGRAIENLVFKWYTPSDGGTISTDSSDKIVFTANATIGTFYDAVMVVAMYNGEIKYATSDVTITDIVKYEQPTTLPVSGWNGLQIVFMVLTLIAAVLLAWVEHYDKVHFKPKD